MLSFIGCPSLNMLCFVDPPLNMLCFIDLATTTAVSLLLRSAAWDVPGWSTTLVRQARHVRDLDDSALQYPSWCAVRYGSPALRGNGFLILDTGLHRLSVCQHRLEAILTDIDSSR